MKRVISFAYVFLMVVSFPTYGQNKISVLFLGNSLTYQNDLPELVKKIASCDRVQLSYKMIALPDYALEDHWSDGNANKEISTGKYNFVVVQQGPSSQTEGYNLLRDYGIKYAQLSRENNSKLVFYMVWPSKARFVDFPGVYKSYKRVAEQTQSMFSPAGQAWLTLWNTNPQFSLYGSDNFHPNRNGSLLAALVLYGTISGKNNLQFVDVRKLKINALSYADLKLLITAAEQTLASEQN